MFNNTQNEIPILLCFAREVIVSQDATRESGRHMKENVVIAMAIM